MNWNIGKYLPSGASCQDFFQVRFDWHCHSCVRPFIGWLLFDWQTDYSSIHSFLIYLFILAFQIVVAGHIHAMYKHSLEERRIIQPGTTPIRRRGGSSQSQKTVQSSATPSLVSFAQERIQGELTQQLFSLVKLRFAKFIVFILIGLDNWYLHIFF